MIDQVVELLEQAQKEIDLKNFGVALEHIDKAIDIAPNESNAYVLKGIVMSQTDREYDAQSAFEKAIETDAQNALAFANYAMHLYQSRSRDKALVMAEAALQIDPENSTAQEIQSLLKESEPIMADRILTADGDVLVEEHRIRMIKRLGTIKWTKIGWAIFALALAVITATGYMTLSIINEHKSMSKGELDIKVLLNAVEQAYGYWYTLLRILDPLARAGALAWTVLDIMDRKRSWLWGAAVFFFNILGFFMFLLFGRKEVKR